MSVRGGRGVRGLWVAAALLILLLPTLPVAPAQGPADPWWRTSDRAQPTLGWAIRIPVVVENREDYFVSDAFAIVDLDFNKLLVAAGWTSEARSGNDVLRGFTLDPDSIRVVPYNQGFVTGPIDGREDTQPIPHVWYPSPLESKELRESDPAGTVLFQVEGGLAPKEKRSFYVYANPLEFGKTPPADFAPAARAPLDAFLWGTRGTVFYGWEPEQTGQANEIVVRAATSAGARVEVSVAEVSRFVPVTSTSTYPNPQDVSGSLAARFRVPPGKPFRISSDNPIVVATYRASDGTPQSVAPGDRWGFVPGRSGSFADDQFDVYGFGAEGNGFSTSVTLIKSGPGSVTVSSSIGGQGVTLSPASPVATITIPSGSWTTLFGSGGQFLVSLGARSVSASTPFHTFPVPALTGGPAGTSFYTALQSDNGFVRLCPASSAAIRIASLDAPALQVYPEGLVESTPPAIVAPGDVCETAALPSASPPHAYEIFADGDERYAPQGPVPFRVVVGAGERDTDPQLVRGNVYPAAGLAGVDYRVEGRTMVFGHYNDTRLNVTYEREANGVKTLVSAPLALQRDGYIALPLPAWGSTGRMHIQASKPIAAAAMDPAVNRVELPGQPTLVQSYGYARYLPGRPEALGVTLGAAEFRGPLVELRSDAGPERYLTLSTGPGTPVSTRLSVVNLGRWINGEGLTDTISVTCSTPAGWTVEGCGKEVTLPSNSAERLTVTVTPSAEDVNAQRTILVEARSKAGGVAATFKLIVHVEVRYGVEMWFDVEGGRKTIDPPIGLSPGETYRYNVVLKNTGSTLDTFNVRPDRDAAEGWTQELLLDDAPVTSVRLDGGESVTLQFRVRAPNAETAPQNLVSLLAESLTSAQAKAIVNTATRIRPKVDLEMLLDPQTRLAEPGQAATFNVTARNKGNDVFRVLFLQDSVLPKGWTATLGRAEIDLDPNVNFTFPLTLTPPGGARAGDLATLKLKAEIDTGGAGGRVVGDEISAVVVVRRIHDLAAPPTLDAQALPGETLRFLLPVTNLGNGQDSVELLEGAVDALRLEGDASVGAPLDGWRVTMDVESVRLELNETSELPLRIVVPRGTPPGQYNVTFTARLSREALQNLSVPVAVSRLARVDLDGASVLATTPGRLVHLSYVAVNNGNVEGTFDLAASAPTGWNATFSPARARLAPGERMPVALSLNASRDAADGVYEVALSAANGDDAPTVSSLSVRLARPELYIANVETSGALRSGDLVVVSATVGNRGDIAAENVSVVLVVDGKVVDRAILARVPVNQSGIASLSWVATSSRGDVKVLVDPDEDIVQATRAQSAASVEFGSRLLPTPAPGLAWLLAGLAVALAARRRWAQ